MTRSEAIRHISDYYYNDNPTDDDKAVFVGAQHFLIDTFADPNDMHNLACFYQEERRFDLAQKYMEMAAEYNFYPAFEALGYIYYYGQNGTVDYKKAFEYFRRGAFCCDDIVRISCEYKLADMYHYGYYVERDEARYISIIERMYRKVTNPKLLRSDFGIEYFPYPDIAYRLAGIRADQGNTAEALRLLSQARTRLAGDIRKNTCWWGNIETMDNIVTLMAKLQPEPERLNIYDLFRFKDTPCSLACLYGDRRFIVSVVRDGEESYIAFDGKYFRNARDFFEKAEIGSKKVCYLAEELWNVEVHHE